MNTDNNIAYLKQKRVADDFPMDKGNVSKCFTKLMEKQFIAKVESGYMINPHLFYIGKKNHVDRREIRQLFDSIIVENNLERRFNLNEDEYKIEEWPDRSE